METEDTLVPEIVRLPAIGSSPHAQLGNIIEALLLAAGEPLDMAQLQALLGGESAPPVADIQQALEQLASDLQGRGIELSQVASGYRLQTRQELQPWVSRLWQERPQRYSRALLETLALIAYRQPITRGEIEEVRGVSVRSNIIRTLQEREWVRVVGHRDIPGKPALFGTTRAFLDYFNLRSLDDLPSLAEIRDLDSLEPELEFALPGSTEESVAEPASDDEAEATGGSWEEEEADTP